MPIPESKSSSANITYINKKVMYRLTGHTSTGTLFSVSGVNAWLKIRIYHEIICVRVPNIK